MVRDVHYYKGRWEEDTKKAYNLRAEVERLTAELLQLREDPSWNELFRVTAERDRYKAALEELARLGNGDQYGNSDGNMIARDALAVRL